MRAPRQDALTAIREALNECPCDELKGGCRTCRGLIDAHDLLEGDDVIPPDGWTVAGEQTMQPGVVLRARPGDRIVTLRVTR